MINKITGTCQYYGCNEPATYIAAGRAYGDWDGEEYRKKHGLRHPSPACYCAEHAYTVANESMPEYIVFCPNCGCVHGTS